MTPELTSTGESVLLLYLLDLARLGYVTVQAPTRRWGFLVGG